MSQKRFVFVCGCSRSGTSTFADLLRAHPAVAMGRERYGRHLRLTGTLTPVLFEQERFCRTLLPDDSHHRTLEPYYATVDAAFETYSLVGDKIPHLYNHFDVVEREFPGAVVFFLVRDVYEVADSFEVRSRGASKHPKQAWPRERDGRAAVGEWNASLAAALAWVDRLDLAIVRYDDLYRDPALLARILGRLRLPAAPAMDAFWAEAAAARDAVERKPREALDAEQRVFIAANADFAAYEAVSALADRPLA